MEIKDRIFIDDVKGTGDLLILGMGYLLSQVRNGSEPYEEEGLGNNGKSKG